MIHCSLNEFEGCARRAARGAGMSWGLADETGKAVRWLAARGLPAAPLLAGLLEQNDGQPYEQLAPVVSHGAWHAAGGLLCPLSTGATLADRGPVLAGKLPLELADTACPLLLAPFLAEAAAASGKPLSLSWDAVRLAVDPSGSCTLAGSDGELAASRGARLCIERHEGGCGQLRAIPGPVAVEESVWLRLTRLAHRTYVPASETSRSRGAGAGLSDND